MARADTYYVSTAVAVEQLADAGFTVTDVLGMDGEAIDLSAASDSVWLSYICAPTD